MPLTAASLRFEKSPALPYGELIFGSKRFRVPSKLMGTEIVRGLLDDHLVSESDAKGACADIMNSDLDQISNPLRVGSLLVSKRV